MHEWLLCYVVVPLPHVLALRGVRPARRVHPALQAHPHSCLLHAGQHQCSFRSCTKRCYNKALLGSTCTCCDTAVLTSLCTCSQGRPLAEDVDVGVLARSTPGMSGAELSNLVNEASLAAARTGADHLDSALLDAALDKVSMGAARRCAASGAWSQEVWHCWLWLSAGCVPAHCTAGCIC